MNKDGILRSASEIADILGKNRLHSLGFNIPSSKVTAQQAVLLNRVEEEPPSPSDVANADNLELEEIMGNTLRSTENLIQQLEGESFEDLPMQELLGLDKQLRSVKGSLKMEVVKKVQLEE